jgi:hypothetical protein
MNAPQFLITKILESNQNPEDLRKELFKHGVLTKDYMNEGLMLLYHKFDSPITNELERECRSLIIDISTLKIKSYSCETPRINKEGMEYLITHSNETLSFSSKEKDKITFEKKQSFFPNETTHTKYEFLPQNVKHSDETLSLEDKPQIINPCYEGTYLSVFNHNDKWYVSTRRCLNSQESIFNPIEKQTSLSHYEMFEEVIKKAGYLNFNEFSQKLDPCNSYYFVLIHHQNKHIIDYTKQFNENYGCICLTTIRNSEMRELDIYENKVSFASYDESGFIFVPKKLESFESFSNANKIIKYNEPPDSEGVVIRVWNKTMNKYNLIKLQSINYQFSKVIGTDKNIFKGLIYLYQNNKLTDYFDQNPNTQNIKKIVNPLNITESFDTIGIVDAVFKVCTSELFELFKILWCLKTGQQQNKPLYELLPKEYRDIMYCIRGLYYKKKSALMTKNKESITSNDIKNSHIKINDIYNYLKSLSTETFIAFLRMRKLMLNWIKVESNNVYLTEFGNISKHCDNVHIKLCAIFTNKLYPDIISIDIPPQKVSSDITINSN